VRILYLALDVQLSDTSAEGVHVLEVTRALAQRISLDLVVPKIHGNPQAAPGLKLPGIRLHSVDTTSDARCAKACEDIAKAGRSQVIYERRYSPKIGAAVSRTTRLPFILEVNGLPDVEREGLGRPPSGSWVTRRLKARIRRSLFARVSHVVAVTPGLANAVQARYKVPAERITVVPNGADVDFFRPMDPVAARTALGIPVDSRVACFVGSLVRWHGLHLLARAAPDLLRENPKLLFVIVGDGPEREGLVAEIQERGMAANFRFTGQVGHDRVPTYINAADVGLLPVDTSVFRVKYGSSALKLYEYLACGRPVIAARYSGLEVLEEVDCGVLVNPADPRELAAAFRSVLHDEERRKAMGDRARRVAVERYSWASVADRLLAVMRQASH